MADRKNKELSFWEHLEELRGVLIRSVIAILLFSIVAFIFKEIVFDMIILGPREPDFVTNVFLCKLGRWVGSESLCFDSLDLEIINITMSGQFMVHMYISMAAGFIIAVPYILLEFWRFVKPALSAVERKNSGGAVAVCSMLFIVGVLFSYYCIVPLTIQFFGNYNVSEEVSNQIRINSYISTVVNLTLATGVLFELPVLIFFLAKVGIVGPAGLKRYRKHAAVVVLIFAAIITPADIFSQVLVSLPLFLLYEAGIVVAKRVEKKRLAG